MYSFNNFLFFFTYTSCIFNDWIKKNWVIQKLCWNCKRIISLYIYLLSIFYQSLLLMRNDICTFLLPLIFKFTFTIGFMTSTFSNTNLMVDLKLSCIEIYKWCTNIMKNAKARFNVFLEVILYWHDILLLINKNYSLIFLSCFY